MAQPFRAGQVMTPKIADQAITTGKIAPGAVSVHITSALNTVHIGGQTFGEASAACPTGTQVTGGGYALALSFPGTPFKISVSEPNGQGWTVLGSSPTPEPQNQELTAFAVCASLTP